MLKFKAMTLNASDRLTPDGSSHVSSCDGAADVLFRLVLRLSPTKLWPVASGPWHLL
jgi:hypothetical protein